MGADLVPLPSDEAVRMSVIFDWGHTKTKVDFGVKHPEEHARDALPVLERLLDREGETIAGPDGTRIELPSATATRP